MVLMQLHYLVLKAVFTPESHTTSFRLKPQRSSQYTRPWALLSLPKKATDEPRSIGGTAIQPGGGGGGLPAQPTAARLLRPAQPCTKHLGIPGPQPQPKGSQPQPIEDVSLAIHIKSCATNVMITFTIAHEMMQLIVLLLLS